jgi:hypothetical protein
MYSLRLQYPNGHAMNLIAKLGLNKLYGKFGMKLEKTFLFLYDTSTDEGLADLNDALTIWPETLQDYIQIDHNYTIIRNIPFILKTDEDCFHGLDVNIAIASAIKAGDN